MTQKSTQTLYDQIGKDRLAELVKVFYDIVETDPTDGAVIHKLHTGHPIKHTRVAQLEFLTGFLGGPNTTASVRFILICATFTNVL
jgi:hemoglobin